jgi:ADP-ribose pyrophosphatase YjhB (NUDIX family)
MNYCSECGAEIIQARPEDDNRLRHVCSACNIIYYQNPKIVAGCIPEHKGKILLCKRAIEPRSGYWTLPAGYMELDETSMEGALRETLEEANARVEILGLYAVFNLPHVNQVYMMYRSRLLDLDYSPGTESLDVALYSENEIPWNDLAFTTIRQTLRYFYADREVGQFRLHTGDIIKQGEKYSFRAGPDEVYDDYSSSTITQRP